MKKPEPSDNTFQIYYDGKLIESDLSYEECAEILDELSDRFYNDQEFDISLLGLKHGKNA